MARAQKIRDIDSMQHNPQVTPMPPATPVIEHPTPEQTPEQEMAEERSIHTIAREDMAETMAEDPSLDATQPTQQESTIKYVEEAQVALHNLAAQGNEQTTTQTNTSTDPDDSIAAASSSKPSSEETKPLFSEQPQRVQATVIESNETPQKTEQQTSSQGTQEAALQVLPPTFPKTTFMQRLKFLFTGHF